MDERFVTLEAIVRAAARRPLDAADAVAVPAQAASPVSPAVSVAPAGEFAHADIVTECSMLRVAALEAFEAATARLLSALANDVLARELLLAPAELGTLVERALAAFAEHEPLRIAVAGSDAERVRTSLPVHVDPALHAGDLIVCVRDGAFESTFAFRLADALERAAASFGDLA